jgi:hypothetical protein
LRQGTDTSAIGAVESTHCNWEATDGSAAVSFNCDAIDQLRSLAIDAFLSLPKRGVEIGGLLLGRVDSTDPLSISIDGFEPVACEHRYGPSYVLSEGDRGHFSEVLGRLQTDSHRQIVGFYRTYTARAPALDPADQDLIRTYFSGPQNVFLLIRPLSSLDCVAALLFWTNGQLQTEPQYAPFAFRSDQMAGPAESPRATEAVARPPEMPPQNAVSQRIPEPAGSLHQPRPSSSAPAAMPRPVRPPRFTEEDLEPSREIPWFWVLLLCLVAVTGGTALYRWKSNQEPGRTQQQIGANQTIPESHENAPAPPPAPAVPQAAPKQTEAPASEPPRTQIERTPNLAPWVAPVVLHQVQPGIPPGIRARIRDRMIVPVVVHVTTSGKVSGAFAQGNGDSLYRYLAEQAVVAARLWRFRPARSKSGIPLEASKTVYFVFTP